MKNSSLVCAAMSAAIVAGQSVATADGPPPELLAELSAAMRALIEPGFEENVGFGFASFDCRVENELVAGSRFDCDAVDMEGDTIRYTLEVDDEGMATVVSAAQPVDDLSPADRAILEPPCLRFLELFAEGDWNTLIADLHPALLEASPPDEIRAQLIPVREALGDIRKVEALTYSRTDSVLHEMEFALGCDNGPGFARFRLVIEGDEVLVTAFVVSPSPGSPLHTRMLLLEGRDTIAGFTGEAIDHIDAPIELLRSVGDAVTGTATLSDGRELRSAWCNRAAPTTSTPSTTASRSSRFRGC